MLIERPYSSQELATRWNVSSQHVRDLIRVGAIPHFRVGRLIRIPARAISEYENACLTIGSNSTAENSTPSGQVRTGKPKERPFVPPTARRLDAA